MKKKMIVTDLDGTLLNIDKKITKKTKEYLINLKNKGYIIVIATGRVLDSAIDITEGAEFADYIISNVGGLIYNKNNNQILFKNVLEKETVEKILSLYNDDINYIDICDSHYYYKYTNKEYSDNDFSKVINDKNIINNIEVIHMDINSNNNTDDIYEYLINNLKNVRTYIMADSYDCNRRWIEINGLNINKFNAIKMISEIECIDNEDIIAFGDSINDIEMITNVGVGVAVGNAIDELKEVADYVTTSHNEDGVITFLDKYLI